MFGGAVQAGAASPPDNNPLAYVYNVENRGADFPPPPLPTMGNLPLIGPLPDPFNWANDPLNIGGTRSTSAADWSRHRSEILAQIQNYEIGTKPAVDPSQVTASYSTNTLTVITTVGTNSLTLTCAVSLPPGNGPFPVVIGIQRPYGSLPFSAFTNRNIAGIAFLHNQVTTYNRPKNTDPFFQLYGPAQNTRNTGQYAAWAWGISRVIDGLYKVTNSLPLDLNHIAVTGCSYAGKMALFAGAMDERVALTVAQESGGGGDTSWRYSHTETNKVETLEHTSNVWFAKQMFQFGNSYVSFLPEDHDELMALYAPRALYCTGNTNYTWLSNPSAFVCDEAAEKIYQTLGVGDRFGFNVDGGHQHCMFPHDQTNDLAYFLDKFMLGKTNLSSTITTYPTNYSNIDYAGWTAWWGTTNAVFPGGATNAISQAIDAETAPILGSIWKY